MVLLLHREGIINNTSLTFTFQYGATSTEEEYLGVSAQSTFTFQYGATSTL